MDYTTTIIIANHKDVTTPRTALIDMVKLHTGEIKRSLFHQNIMLLVFAI
jgi:hypothetical protein